MQVVDSAKSLESFELADNAAKKLPVIHTKEFHISSNLKSSQNEVVKKAWSGNEHLTATMNMDHLLHTHLNGQHTEMVKRTSPGDNLPTASKKKNTLEESLQAAVIDRTYPNGWLSIKLWELVESRLIDEIAIFTGNADAVSFNGAEWSKGAKIVNCDNRKSFEFLKTIVRKCDSLCPESKLDVVCATELPLRPIVEVWIPPPVKPVETVLAVIAKQNNGFLTSEWKLIPSLDGKESIGSDLSFSVDQDSLKGLKAVRGVVRYGLKTIKFQLPKSNKRTKKAAGGTHNLAPQ